MESVQPVQPGFKVDIKSRGRFNEFKKVIWEIDLQHGILMRRSEPPIKSRSCVGSKVVGKSVFCDLYL